MFMVIQHHSVTYVKLGASMYIKPYVKERMESTTYIVLSLARRYKDHRQPVSPLPVVLQRIGFGVRNRRLKHPLG